MDDKLQRIVFETDFDDRAAAVRLMLEIDGIDKVVWKYRVRALIGWLTFLAISVLGSAWGLVLIGGNLRTPLYAVVVATLFGFAFTGVYRHVLTSGVRRRIAEMVFDVTRGAAGPGIDGFQQITITDDALVLQDSCSCEFRQWPCVRKVVRQQVRCLVQIMDGRWVMIPIRAFNFDEKRMNDFVDELERVNSAAGGWDHVVREFLTEFRSRCVGCGYELGGIQSARCPECGQAIEHEHFRSAWTERIDDRDPAFFGDAYTLAPDALSTRSA